jgi:Flp pilus assembly secretin CpaC
LKFENASILWLDSLTDNITIELSQTIPIEMAVVTVKKAVMNVYETDSRSKMMEKYSITCD